MPRSIILRRVASSEEEGPRVQMILVFLIAAKDTPYLLKYFPEYYNSIILL